VAKQKHAKPEEHFLETIRAQKKQIKHLQQEIKRLQKELGYNQNKSTKKDRIDREIEPDCPECSKGFLKEVEIVGRVFDVCSLCKYRSPLKKALKRK